VSILVDESTRLLVQGITGREAANFTRECIDYGTQVVAGVTPGRGGQDVRRVPVYDTVAEAQTFTQPNATLVSVPPALALDAVLEAIDAEIELIVVITERIPRKDVSLMLREARSADVRIVGPNSLGLITPEQAKVGSIGGTPEDARRAYQPGPLGIVSRSGGMTTELASVFTQAGIGQSTCVSVGGDPLIGTTLLDAYRLFSEDEQTEAVVFFSEPGGSQELALADCFREQADPKPAFGFLAGRFVDQMPGTRFGHAGAMIQRGGVSVREKVALLEESGIPVARTLRDLVSMVIEAGVRPHLTVSSVG
jgi:succinyl-CoA synthetase alpha subunit